MADLRVNNPSFYWLDTWLMANIIQLATQDFCRRFLSLQNDPCGRQYDQMTQAARSGVANIAEGNARHATSKETEMKLTDVARASIAELAHDYFNWLMQLNQAPWSNQNEEFKLISEIRLAKPQYKENIMNESALHILAQKQKFNQWLQADSVYAANCLLILCNRLIVMLTKQIQVQLNNFTQEGGFTEALTNERLQFKKKQNTEENAPLCPVCNQVMIRRMARKGENSGKEFWSCSGYPDCNGTRNINDVSKK